MKDYAFFIPGYTGFCPELREHFGQTYGHATRHIIQKKPHLKERLAPVHYKYRRFERVKSTSGKHHHKQDDHSKAKHRADTHDSKYRTDYEAGDACQGLCDLDYGGDYIYPPEKCCGDYESVAPCRVKYTAAYANCDEVRRAGRECVYPKYVFIEGIAECMPPEMRTTETRQKLPHERYSHAATRCAHVREPLEHRFPTEISFAPMPYVHLKEYHPEDCGHKKDTKFRTDRRTRKEARVKPHRCGGVIPKYTGHVPGMQFSFGESYGPISDRLLRKHHDRMKELTIKY